MISKEDFNEDNLVQCECSDWYLQEQGTTSPDGGNVCPNCYQGWLSELIEAHKETLRVCCSHIEDLGEKPSKEKVENFLQHRICEKVGVSLEELGEDGWESLEIRLLQPRDTNS